MLNPRKKYLQIAFNRSMDDVKKMISALPSFDQLLIEAGTSFIKKYGADGVRQIGNHWRDTLGQNGYIVADLKCMDRGSREVEEMAKAGASAATCLGLAPIETIDEFTRSCRESDIDSMIDMMNVEFPFEVLQKLKRLPSIVVLHRGVDEGQAREVRPLPLHQIRRIKSTYSSILISVAGGETPRDVRRAFFNDSDIAVVWRAFYDQPDQSRKLAEDFISMM